MEPVTGGQLLERIIRKDHYSLYLEKKQKNRYGHYESKSHFYIVMEPVTGGQLLERIIRKDHYSETEAAHCFVQIISAIK